VYVCGHKTGTAFSMEPVDGWGPAASVPFRRVFLRNSFHQRHLGDDSHLTHPIVRKLEAFTVEEEQHLFVFYPKHGSSPVWVKLSGDRELQ